MIHDLYRIIHLCLSRCVYVNIPFALKHLYLSLRLWVGYMDKYEYFEQKHRFNKRWLTKRFGNVLCSNNYGREITIEPKDQVIWQFWWQGENMPLVTQRCLESVRKYNNGHKVVLLTKDNIRNYINFDDDVYDQIGKSLSLQNFSDLLRFYLLSEYGGVWIDATVLLTKEIPAFVFNERFFSLKLSSPENFSPSYFNWATFFLCTNKKNTKLCKNIYSFMIEYIAQYHRFMDYLMIDYAISIVCDSDSEYHKIIRRMPIVNPDLYWLQNNINEKFDQETWKKIKEESFAFKLSNKLPINTNDKDNNYNVIIVNKQF